MVNVVVLERWIDNDLTVRDKGNGKGRYGICTLAYITGNGDYAKRHKTTLFFEDGFQHNALKVAETMKVHKGSRVIVTGVLRDPAEEKQTDGTWKKPGVCSIAVNSIQYAASGTRKDSGKDTAPAEKEPENYAPAAPAPTDLENYELTDDNDFPF